MVFSTPTFLFYFLALTLLIYYLVPRKFRNVVILCASLFFYYWGERVYVVIMFLSTAIRAPLSLSLRLQRSTSRPWV